MADGGGGATLPLPRRLAYGLGQLGDAIVHFSFETFVFFYYTQVLGVSGTLAGLAVFIALVFDALTDPLIGSLSDSTRSRFGRRHPFMFAGPAPLAVCFYFLFVPPEGFGEWPLFLWLTGFSVLARFSLTLFGVSYMSLGAELSQDYVGRSRRVSLLPALPRSARRLSPALTPLVRDQRRDRGRCSRGASDPHPAHEYVLLGHVE